MWKALRLVVDTGIHYMEFSKSRALRLHQRFAWDNSDFSKKEIIRYQSNPGEATTFMIGQRYILTLRNRLEKNLSKEFDLKEFHYQVLSQGSSSFDYLEYHMDSYANCKVRSQNEHCSYILQPTTTNVMRESKRDLVVKKPERFRFC